MRNSPKQFAEYLAEQGKTLADIAPQSRTRLVVAGRLTRRDTPTTPPPADSAQTMDIETLQHIHRQRVLFRTQLRELNAWEQGVRDRMARRSQ